MKVFNPATGELVGEYPLNNLADVRTAIDAARTAQREWGARSAYSRARVLLRARGVLMEQRDALAQSISLCTGKTRLDALATEVLPSIVALSYYIRSVPRYMKPKPIKRSSVVFFNKASVLHQVPWGVVGIISPWNYPFGIPFHEIVCALLCGNAVVLKLASQAQPLARFIIEIFEVCKLPAGLFSVLNVSGKEAGTSFLKGGVDKLFFTGSVDVGKQLMKEASETLTPLSLELGGNDGMIVLDDANLQRAVEGAVWAGFSNCGQSCGGVQRIYVQESVYARFVELLRERILLLRQGQDSDFNIDVGALATSKQLETIRRQVQEALNAGAVVLAQSKDVDGGGFFHPAIVLGNVDHTMSVMKEEVFGPVLTIMKFREDGEAVSLVNDSLLGLTASVWSSKRARAEKIAAQLEAGAVTLNDHLMSHGMAETPWGGFKQSALGRSHGVPGFQEMTQPKVVIRDSLHRLDRNIWWFPSSRSIYEGLCGVLDAFYARSPLKRFSGLARMVRLYAARFFK